MIHSRDNIKNTYETALNGFEVKRYSNWKSRHEHWEIVEKGKKYIIFKFTDDKKIFKFECPDDILRRLTKSRAISILLKNGVSEEDISQLGNYPNWWNESFCHKGGEL